MFLKAEIWDAPEDPKRVYGPTCEYCDGTVPLGHCYSCGQPLVLSYQGQFDDGEHVCSSDCTNPDCYYSSMI